MSFIFYENFRSHKISAVFWFFFKDRIYRSSYWHVNIQSRTLIKLKKQLTQLSVKEHILHNKLGMLGKGEGVRVRLFTKHRKFFFDVTNDTLYTLYISFTHFLAEFCSRFKLVQPSRLRSFRECTVCFCFFYININVF